MATFNIKVRTKGNIANGNVTNVKKFTFDGTDIDNAIALAKVDPLYIKLATLKSMVWEEDI